MDVVRVGISASGSVDVFPSDAEVLAPRSVVAEVHVEVAFDAAVRSRGTWEALLFRMSSIDLTRHKDPQLIATVDA